jgi:hypothetical protein
MSPSGTSRGNLVVEEVKQALERAKIRNLAFTRLDPFERNGRP